MVSQGVTQWQQCKMLERESY